MTAELSSIVADLVQEIPIKIKDKDFTEDNLHSQLKVMTQQLLLGPNAKDNVAGLMKYGKDALVKTIDTFQSDINDLATQAGDFADDLGVLVNDPNIRQIKTNISSAVSTLNSKLDDVKQKTASLQTRISSKNDFSLQRIDGIVTTLNEMKNLIPSAANLGSLYSAQSNTMTTNSKSISDSFTSIISHAGRVAGFKDSLVANILPGDIFASNFTKLYSMYKEIGSSLESVKSNLKTGDATRVLQSVGNVIGKVNSIIGQVKTLGNKQFATDLKNTADSTVQQMKSLGDNIIAHVFPVAEVKKVENDVKALVKTVDRIINGGKVPTPAVVTALKNRIDANIGTVKNNLTTFVNILNVFEPAVTADIKAFTASIGNIAPAANDALLQGDVAKFEKTLTNPNLLTLAGHAVAEINSFLATAENLTTPDLAKIGTLISFLGGQHKRQLQAASIMNLAENRKKALKSFDYFVTTFLEPTRMLVKDLQTKFGGTA